MKKVHYNMCFTNEMTRKDLVLNLALGMEESRRYKKIIYNILSHIKDKRIVKLYEKAIKKVEEETDVTVDMNQNVYDKLKKELFDC